MSLGVRRGDRSGRVVPRSPGVDGEGGALRGIRTGRGSDPSEEWTRDLAVDSLPGKRDRVRVLISLV